MARYCVIGAGAAGMSAADVLLRHGFDVDVFEKSDRVAGHWNTDYEALHLITARDQTHFEDYPMPSDYPHFPSRDQVRDYMHAFARDRGLADVIRFGTEITAVEPIAGEGPTGSAGWRVTTSRGETFEYDGVLVANGHLWDQRVPEISRGFTGTQLHSGSYRNTDQIEGDRVLVVGAGNSGCDLAVDAAQHRYRVDIVMRHGSYFQPKSYFGVPRQLVPWLAEFSPDEQDLLNRLLARITLGQASDYPGMPPVPHRTLAEGSTVVNTLLPYWVQHGRIGIRPGIDSIEGRLVRFADGTADEYDTILWATGFRASLPFLADALVPRRNGVPLRVAAGIVVPGLEKLYLIGMTAPRGPQVPVYSVQTRVVERMLELHEHAPGGYAPVAERLAREQEPDDRIDIVRATWNDQLDDTGRLLDALARESADARPSPQRA